MTISPSWEMYPIKNHDIIQKKIGVSIQFLSKFGPITRIYSRGYKMDYLREVHTNSNINMVPTYYWNISRGNIKIKYKGKNLQIS